MSRTFVTEYDKRQIKNPDPANGVGWEGAVKSLIESSYEALKSCQADCDKAGDPDDEAYYAGQVSILTWLLDTITVEPYDEHLERLERELHNVGQRIDQAERGTEAFDTWHREQDRINQQIHDLKEAHRG